MLPFPVLLTMPSLVVLLNFIQWKLIFIAKALELGGTVCRLPRNVGWKCGRSTSSTAYYFDSEQSECLEFTFHGCGGNANRFATKEECLDGCRSMMLCAAGLPLMDFAGNIKRCVADQIPCPGAYHCVGEGMQSVCCKRPDRICSQSVNPGSLCGIAPQRRYYYDHNSNQCRPFTFLGCSGNDNNFKDHRQCITLCARTVSCLKGEPYADRYDANRAMECETDSSCPWNYTCTGLGNGRKSCCPSKAYVCGITYNWSQDCLEEVHGLWTFDVSRGQCIVLDERACPKQLNTFSSLDQCIDFCIGSCPNKLRTLYNSQTAQPQLCDPSQQSSSCPPGFKCFKSSEYTWICCRTEPHCPSGQSIAQVNPRTYAQKRCNPNGTAASNQECQPGYTCQQADNLEWICCTVPLSCPYGMRQLPRKYQLPQICSPEVLGSCPASYSCVRGVGYENRHLCCRPEQACLVPYMENATRKMIKCSPGAGRCPQDASCLLYLKYTKIRDSLIQPNHHMYYCCLQQYHVVLCNNGQLPLADNDSNIPRKCNEDDELGCPDGYQCEMNLDGTSSKCCPDADTSANSRINAVMNEEHCIEAQLYRGTPRTCRGPDDFSCASGKCRQSVNSTYYCCRQ